ncbi:hypothetical protein [Halomonas sp. C05BenzN]|uniref:hypothetical protein n=1 Tax=Halomonas sp. C05BenzN TaxID=3411041 RepID=UPI003B9515FD
MDTRESKTPEEERVHVMGQRTPEDYDNPEPDEEQPEAKQGPQGLQRVLPIVVVLLGLLIAAMLIFSGGVE